MTRIPLLALVLLLALCGGASWSLWPHAWGAPAVDLFRYWAIGAVHQAFSGQLGSPYGAVDAYSQALMAMLGAGSQRELLKTAEVALPFDLTASPLHYYLYALAPPDYLQFQRAYRWVQVAGAAGAVMLLTTVASGRRGFPVLFAGLLCFAHDGLLLDVNVGNTNALQLLLLALVTLMSPRLAAAPALASGAGEWRWRVALSVRCSRCWCCSSPRSRWRLACSRSRISRVSIAQDGTPGSPGRWRRGSCWCC